MRNGACSGFDATSLVAGDGGPAGWVMGWMNGELGEVFWWREKRDVLVEWNERRNVFQVRSNDVLVRHQFGRGPQDGDQRLPLESTHRPLLFLVLVQLPCSSCSPFPLFSLLPSFLPSLPPFLSLPPHAFLSTSTPIALPQDKDRPAFDELSPTDPASRHGFILETTPGIHQQEHRTSQATPSSQGKRPNSRKAQLLRGFLSHHAPSHRAPIPYSRKRPTTCLTSNAETLLMRRAKKSASTTLTATTLKKKKRMMRRRSRE